MGSDDTFIAGAIIAGVLIAAVLIAWQRKVGRRRLEVYGELAAARGATVLPPRWYQTFPSLTFEHAGWPARLGHRRVGGNHPVYFTELKVHGGVPATGAFSVRAAGALSKLAQAFGYHDIDVGDPEFDRAFTVRGRDPGAVRATLGPTVRAALDRLRTRFPRASYATWDGKVLTVGTTELVEGRERLEEFLAAALAVVDGLR